ESWRVASAHGDDEVIVERAHRHGLDREVVRSRRQVTGLGGATCSGSVDERAVAAPAAHGSDTCTTGVVEWEHRGHSDFASRPADRRVFNDLGSNRHLLGNHDGEIVYVT